MKPEKAQQLMNNIRINSPDITISNSTGVIAGNVNGDVNQKIVKTEGGAYADGNIDTHGGDFVGRDKKYYRAVMQSGILPGQFWRIKMMDDLMPINPDEDEAGIKPWEQRTAPGMGGGGSSLHSAPEPELPDDLVVKVAPPEIKDLIDDQTRLSHYPRSISTNPLQRIFRKKPVQTKRSGLCSSAN